MVQLCWVWSISMNVCGRKVEDSPGPDVAGEGKPGTPKREGARTGPADPRVGRAGAVGIGHGPQIVKTRADEPEPISAGAASPRNRS